MFESETQGSHSSLAADSLEPSPYKPGIILSLTWALDPELLPEVML